VFLTTKTETVLQKFRHRSHAIFLTRVTDVYQCDHCKEQITCLRLVGESLPTEPFYCACNELVSVTQ